MVEMADASTKAAMYALKYFFNTPGKGSVTNAPCIWVKRTRANTRVCKVKDLVIKKDKNPPTKNENINTRSPKIVTEMSVLLRTLIHQTKSILDD